MQRGMAFFAVGVLLFLGSMASAQTIVCDGHTCSGSGVVSYDVQLRDYVYRVTGGAVPQVRDSVFIGTHDPDLTHYSSVCMPPGWTYEIIPMSRPDYSNPINHGSVSPASDGNCPYTLLFRNVSGAALSSSTPTDFGFNYYGYPHNVDWMVAASPAVSANWAVNIGIGAGPVHGPKCDTLCANGFPVPYHYLAGRKDNFATADGPEPSSPNPALLAVMAALSGGANPYFDSPTYDRAFGHTFTGWNSSGCVVGAQLCFRITPINSGCSNDVINIRENAVNATWACYIKFLKAWKSGIPADTFWTVGDTLDVCLNLAHMPLIKRGTTYYWPTNVLATLQDGDMDFLMDDDTKIDFLELTLEICTDTCYATGDVNGDGLSLTAGDLAALIAYVNNGTLPLGPLWQCDLNGDDHVDQADIDIYQCFFIQGMSCFPIYPVPTDCDPDTVRGACCIAGECTIRSQANCLAAGGNYQGNGTSCSPNPCPQTYPIVIFDLLHTAQGNADIDTSAGKLIVSNIGSTGTDGVTIGCSPDCDPHELALWEGVLENPDLSGSLPVGAKLEAAYKGVIGDIPDQLFMTMSQTKMAANRWQLGVSSAATTYTVEAWRDGWVVFHGDSLSAADLGYVAATAKGIYPTGFKGSTTGKPASIVSTGWEFGASPDGVQWTWAAQGVANLTIDELVVSPPGPPDTEPHELRSVTIRAKDIPSFTIRHERKADIDTAALFGQYHWSEGFANITSVDNSELEMGGFDFLVDLKQYAGVSSAVNGISCCQGTNFSCCPKRWSGTLENLNLPGTLPDSAKMRVLFRSFINGKPNQPLMALFQTKRGSNQWSLGVSSITSTYTVEAKRHNAVVFHGNGMAAADLGYIVETAKGIYPTGFKGSTTGKPASVVSTGWNLGASPDGVQWTWAAHGVANLTIDELEVSWTTPNVVYLDEVTMMVMDIPTFTIIDEVRSNAVRAGDANDDEAVNVGDAVYVINYIFKGGPPPPSKGEGDANGDCALNVGDAVYVINFIFKGGPPPIINDDCIWP